MKYSNNFGMPRWLAETLQASDEAYVRHGDISVTGLIGPPMIRQLYKWHGDEAEQDVTDCAYALLGNGVHAIVQRSQPASAVLAETTLFASVNGWTVTGTLDLLDDEGWLNDIKVTSVWAFVLGNKPEWTAQLNLYSWLLQHNGFAKPTGLRIVAFLRDWSKYEAERNPDYPQKQIHIIEIKQWSDDMTAAYIRGRVALHQAVEGAHIENTVPICTREERWQDNAKYKVYRGANQRAMNGGVCNTEDEAAAFVAAQDPKFTYRVEVFPSEAKRCKGWCAVAKWCPFGKQVLEGGAPDDKDFFQLSDLTACIAERTLASFPKNKTSSNVGA